VHFIQCDTELKESHTVISKAHTSLVSCAAFSQIQNDKLRCATGSYDRYINLYEIDNIKSKNFNSRKNVQLYAK
jgi:WD40 repeat protein